MRSTADTNPVDNDWIQVSTAAPCPICGSEQNCRTHADEAFACCAREPSDWRLSNGGWLHRVEITMEVEGLEAPGRLLRDSGVVVRGAREPWLANVTAVGSST